MKGRFGALSRLLGVACVALSGLTCAEPSQPPLVLISIDTLRSDRLPIYGYQAIATPQIDALRSDAVLFERAYSPTPTTLPAHASMLTGLLPPAHGVRGNNGYTLDGEGLPYLPRLLRQAGYVTGGAVASFVMRAEVGLDTGFDLFEDDIDYQANRGSAGLQRTGEATLKAILPWLRSVADRPFFLFLHLYDPHTPYDPPEPYASRYESPYDAEIAAIDEVIGTLVAELRSLEVYDRAAILLTSDHGEGLGDHVESEHGIFVYREAIQVPLLLKLPSGERAGESVDVPAQLSDVTPTFLELAGAGVPSGSEGIPLTRLGEAERDRRIHSETFFPRFYFGWSELISVIEGRHHFIESPEPELYDLDADPGEQDNRIEEDPQTARRLGRLASAYEARLVDPEYTDAQTWQRMASLGYVGHGQTRIDAELPAPASQSHLLVWIRDGLRRAGGGDHEGAVALLTKVLKENPYTLVAWEQLGRSLERLGRPERARLAYDRALEISGTAPHLLLAAARTSMLSGDGAAATDYATRALEWDEAAARALLGEIALSAGDLEQAESNARASIDLRLPNTAAMFILAQVQLRKGEFEAALQTTTAAREAVEGPIPRLGVIRANILGSMGRFEEAEQSLREELRDFPENVAAYGRLALLLARQGRPDEAVTTIRQLVEANPNPQGYQAAARALDQLGDPRAAQALMNEARRRFPELIESG